MLSTDDFPVFFEEVHGHEPFPWQSRLVEKLAQDSRWPAVLDLPTGSGKTAAIDIAVFHLALESGNDPMRHAPVRIAFVVDRRLVVDDAYERAKVIERKLASASESSPGSVTARVAEQLKRLAGDGPPLLARRLRGGIPREDDWARTPSQPTVLCSTVDQIGSRLLFRGYGVSDSMKPVHAGLIGSDCLILLDEAHLAEPFLQTLKWVATYRGESWLQATSTAPWGVSMLTATPALDCTDRFPLTDEDRRHPVLKQRIEAPKPARLVSFKDNSKTAANGEPIPSETASDADSMSQRIQVISQEIAQALSHFTTLGVAAPVIGVVVNRVARARAVFEDLCCRYEEAIAKGELEQPLLMIGPARPVDREQLVGRLEPIRTRNREHHESGKVTILVATQCIEAGVDIDMDALVTEVSALDALRQRFGRLNRAGRDIKPFASIIAAKSELGARYEDPIYGRTIRPTWEYLSRHAVLPAGKKAVATVDFGNSALDRLLAEYPVPKEGSESPFSRKDDAPILMPAHVDLLSQTSPVPSTDPEVGLYLHGNRRQANSVSVVWRADVDSETSPIAARRLMQLVPLRSMEAIDLPVWAIRRWLQGDSNVLGALSDVASKSSEGNSGPITHARRRSVFRFCGLNERSQWITPDDIRPGDSIVVPAKYGGTDEFGWNPRSDTPATDVAGAAAKPFAGRRFTVRVAPGLLENRVGRGELSSALAEAVSRRWRDVRQAVEALELPDQVRKDLAALDMARSSRVVAYTEAYGMDSDGRPCGVVFVALFGIQGGMQTEEGRPNSTEDDSTGSTPGFRLSLARHSADVESKSEEFATKAGLPADRIVDLKVAGFLHDAGKIDPRFQGWLQYDDPLGPDPDRPEDVLAKSERPLPRAARQDSQLPSHWRHEAFSVRLAPLMRRFSEARDPELVLWLLGTHHGHGRPFFPHSDPMDSESRYLPCLEGFPNCVDPGDGPQSLAYDWQGNDWATIFVRLKKRYGTWELARLETILRLADHRASEEAMRRAVPEGRE